MTVVYILLVAAFVHLVFGLLLYNSLMRIRQAVKQSWALVDVELQRRHDLIGNLVETVKAAAAFERTTLNALVTARNAAVAAAPTVTARTPVERTLVARTRELFAVAENYPDLKVSGNFLHLQQELVETEDRIAVARRVYNANVRSLNIRVEVVPSNLVAKMAHVERAAFFEVDDALRSAPPPSTKAVG